MARCMCTTCRNQGSWSDLCNEYSSTSDFDTILVFSIITIPTRCIPCPISRNKNIHLCKVACTVAWHHADPGTSSLTIVQAPGVMTVSGFDKGEERGPASCSGTYHDDMEFVMTVSTKLYTSGGLCGIMFRITSTETGRSTMAEVVDECHDCRDDQVGAPAGVWGRLGLDTNVGLAPVILTW
uniref:Uncharacterized protein n=1 Tax=Aegilops tauschii TaxID=37682 RepID=M8C1E3_AEGTA